MAYWLNRKLGTHWRPRTWAPLPGVLAFILIVAAIFSITWASHSTTTWPFTTAANYTFDSDKVEVTGGLAFLPTDFTRLDDSQADFTGTLNNVTIVDAAPAGDDPNDYIEITDLSSDAEGFGLPVVGSGSYTSPTIDSQKAGTKWISMNSSITPDLQQGNNFPGNGTTIVSGLEKFTVMDIDRDGEPDPILGSTATKDVTWYDGGASWTARTAYGPTAPCSHPTWQVLTNTLPIVSEDLDNDLDIDIIFSNPSNPGSDP
ncbi:MAG: hypothetical protein V3W08_04390, partial [Candidatus Binatia bacterium]